MLVQPIDGPVIEGKRWLVAVGHEGFDGVGPGDGVERLSPHDPVEDAGRRLHLTLHRRRGARVRGLGGSGRMVRPWLRRGRPRSAAGEERDEEQRPEVMGATSHGEEV